MAYNYKGVSKNDLDGNKPLPEGRHELVIQGIVEKYSKTGSPMVEVSFRPSDPQYRDCRVSKHYIILDNEWTERNIGRLLAAMGKDPERGGEIEFSEFSGEYVEAQIEHKHDEQYGIQARVRRFISNFDVDSDSPRPNKSMPKTAPVMPQDNFPPNDPGMDDIPF